jgi:hypothetical protein
MPESGTGVPHIARSYDYWQGGTDSGLVARDP